MTKSFGVAILVIFGGHKSVNIAKMTIPYGPLSDSPFFEAFLQRLDLLKADEKQLSVVRCSQRSVEEFIGFVSGESFTLHRASDLHQQVLKIEPVHLYFQR